MGNGDDMKVLAVVPAYNESGNIKVVCESLEKMKASSDFTFDYIVINDGSTDNTGNICADNNYPCINLIHNLGIGGAVQTGYIYAKKNNYDIVLQFDGDNQHDVNSISDLVMPIIRGECDMTVGSRYVDNKSTFKSSFARQFGIKFLSFILRITTGQKIKDVTSGFRAINKGIISLFASDYPSDYPEPETLVTVIKKGYTVKEVGVVMHKRLSGTSSITPLKSIYYMAKVTYAMLVRGLIEGGK